MKQFVVAHLSIGLRVQGAIDCQRKKGSEADNGGECDEEVRARR